MEEIMTKTFKQQVILIGNDYVCQDCNERKECKLIPGDCVFLQEFIDAILSAHNAELDKVLCLCNKIIELAENGDYSNGNVAQGTDEGAFMAMRRLTELKKELAHIRAMAGEA
jgi:hypothetical protein